MKQEDDGFCLSKEWRGARKLALQRDHYVCQLRLSKKCTRKANTVHHIKERSEHPELALVLSNLVSCCYWCHEETKKRKINEALIRARERNVRVIRIACEED